MFKAGSRRYPGRGKLTDAQRPIPPYVPYRTFRNFLDTLREGIPARIDRSVWGPRFSGSNGIQLMTALRVLNLVDDQGRPTPELERLVQLEGDPRRAALRSLLERNYAPVFGLDLERASRAQFREAFRSFGTKEAVLARCERFFVQAAQDAGVELSSFILDRRRGARRQPGARTRPSSPAPLSVTRTAVETPRDARTLAAMILEKYPAFNPQWEPGVQERWLEGITRLYEGMRAEVAASRS